MITRLKSTINLALIITLMAASCTTQKTPLPTSTTTKSEVTPTFTNTFLPSSTSTQTFTPTFTRIPPTQTPLPTLPLDLAKARFEELMQTNGNCELSCWWGIMPGETSFQEADNVLAPLRSLDPDAPYKGFIYIPYLHGTNGISFFVEMGKFYSENSVSMISIMTSVSRQLDPTNSEPIFDDQKYLELMKNYTLSKVLTTFGKPDQVISEMEMNGDGGFPTYLDMRLLYPQKGIFVGFRAYSQYKNPDNVIICPKKSFISIWLIPPTQDDSYRELLSTLDSGWNGFFSNDNATLLPLDKLEDMTLDSFYEKYKQPTSACWIIPSSLWPRY